MKKFFIGALIAVCLACLGFAVACTKSGEPKYYTLVFEKTAGVAFDCEIPNGYEVKQGVTVTFSVTYSDSVIPESIESAVVKANGSELKADGEGKYSFAMSSDTKITLDGIAVLNRYNVTFTKGNDWIKFLSADGETEYGEEGVRVTAGEQLSFKVDVSVYYGDSSYEVLANTRILKAENGVYTFTVTETTNITVSGLELDTPFYARNDFTETADNPYGSANNPYKISRPIDLFELANHMSGSSIYFSSVCTAHYILTNDIDMKGEQLYIIGHSEEYFFGGDFNGNGHTISNYYIDDSVIDQSNYLDTFMPYIGLFGFASATTNSSVNIYNLNLENFTIYVNASKGGASETGSSFSVGGIVGAGFGVNITGCSAKGTITVDADDNQFGYAGGIAGNLYSAYASDTVRYHSVISSCSSGVDISCQSGHVYAAGGIVGLLNTTQERTAAIVINSYSTGSVAGAMYTGGIAGRLSSYGSVQNCYSSGAISARNSVGLIAGNEQLAYAYAGGIVGYADSDSIVADSFSTALTYAYSAADSSGAKYSFAGGIAGGKDKSGAEDKTLNVHAQAAQVINCYGDIKNSDINDDFIQSTLGWDDKDWVFDGKNLPEINKNSTEKNFTVTIKDNGDNGVSQVQISSLYMPVSYWYLYSENMPEFIDNVINGTRSYGYFFDKDLKAKVPYGYVPMRDVTLYVGFADYGEVAGEYYLNGGGSKKLVLGADGTLTYSDGALECVSDYTYDGKEIVLRDTFIAIALNSQTTYSTFKATLSGNVLSVFDNTYYTSAAPLKAVKASATVKYGVYFGSDGGVYEFKKDGTGTATANGRVTVFTYDTNGNSVNIYIGNTKVAGAINASGNFTAYRNVSLTAADDFYGYWVSPASSHRQYYFDGKGGWLFKEYGYDADGAEVLIGSATGGSYTIKPDGSITFNGINAAFTAEGFLEIEVCITTSKTALRAYGTSLTTTLPLKLL